MVMTKESERRIRQIWDQADPLESSALPSASAVLSKGLSREKTVRRRIVAAMSSAAVLLAVITGGAMKVQLLPVRSKSLMKS